MSCPQASGWVRSVRTRLRHMKAFANEPVLEMRRAAVRSELTEALAGVDRQLPLDVASRWVMERAPGRAVVD